MGKIMKVILAVVSLAALVVIGSFAAIIIPDILDSPKPDHADRNAWFDVDTQGHFRK